MNRQDMSRIFTETPSFTRKWNELGLGDDDLFALQVRLLEDAKLGDPIPGLGGLRKVRIPIENRGKRGGGRVIYLDIEVKERIYLLDVYAKNRREDMSQEEKKALRKLVNILKEEK